MSDPWQERWAACVLAQWIKPDDQGAHIDAIKKLAAECQDAEV
jgi:hypothetical protein